MENAIFGLLYDQIFYSSVNWSGYKNVRRSCNTTITSAGVAESVDKPYSPRSHYITIHLNFPQYSVYVGENLAIIIPGGIGNKKSRTKGQNYLTDTVAGSAFHLDIPIQSIYMYIK